MQKLWTSVDDYFGGLLAPPDAALAEVLANNAKAGLPPIDVSPLQGRFLGLLAGISGARRILEIGTLGGYSTICLARGCPAGRVVTLEADPMHADVARANFSVAGVADRIEIRVGKAADTLPVLAGEGGGPFDLIFIDADKPGNPLYLEWALKLSRPGTVIVCDNVVREGRVIDGATTDAAIIGVRRFAEMVAAEPRLTATAIQTVGVKGYDGFVLAVVSG